MQTSSVQQLIHIVGSTLDERSAASLLRRTNGNVDMALNLFFDEQQQPQTQTQQPPPQRIEEAGKKEEEKEEEDEEVIPPKRPRLSDEKRWPKTLGECVVIGFSMVAGRLLLYSGCELVLDRQTETPYVGRMVRRSPNTIVRFLANGREIGRIPSDFTKILCKLMDMQMVAIKATCVDAPEPLKIGDNVILSLTIQLTMEAFQPKLLASADYEQSRCEALLSVVSFLGLRPSIPCRSGLKRLHVASDLAGDSSRGPSASDAAAITAASNGQDIVELDDSGKQPNEPSDLELSIIYEKAQMFDLRLQPTEPAPSFRCVLREYQKQALTWMIDQETFNAEAEKSLTLHPLWEEYRFSGDSADEKFYVNPHSGNVRLTFPAASEKLRGGILADEMGLGKTIEILSLIHTSPPSPGFERRVMPQQESGEKSADVPPLTAVKATLVVCPMSLLGQWLDELNKTMNPSQLSVLTYYGSDRSRSLSNFGSYDVILTTYGVVSSEFEKDPNLSTELYRCYFYRVVLDEAHLIKSRTANVSKACISIQAERRWAVTGTPIQNSIEDIFSLFCFLQVDPWSSYSFWRQCVGLPFERKDPQAFETLQTVLQPLILRRTKDSKDGSGNPIVQLPEKICNLEFVEFSSAEKDFYEAVFSRSKLRFDDYYRRGAVLSNYASIFQLLVRLRQACDHPFLTLGQSEHVSDGGSNTKDAGVFNDIDTLVNKFVGSDQTLSQRYASEVAKELKDSRETLECPMCFEPLVDCGVMTPCLHVSCRDCMVDYLSRFPSEVGECPICRKPVTESDLVDIVNKEQPEVVDKYLRSWKASSKIEYLLAHLRRIMAETGDKAVVFSQWTSMLSLLEIALKKENFQFLRLDGSMRQQDRERVLRSFGEDGTPRIFLVSLRSGGVGLNLTAANHCFLMDLWWNPAVEEQAIDRIHRLGQEKKVFVTRFVVRGTVEEKMLDLQSRKRLIAQTALGVTKDELKMTRLEDLKRLFS